MSSPVASFILDPEQYDSPKSAKVAEGELRKPRQQSWSRRNRKNRRSALNHETTNFVKGDSFICVSKDQSWFQGHVVTDQNHHYKVIGRKLTLKDLMTPPSGMFISKKRNSLSSSSIDTPVGTTSSSCSSSSSCLDTNLVQQAMEKLDNEVDLSENSCDSISNDDFTSGDLYNVTVVDFETGENYHADRVPLMLNESECAIDSDLFRFKSEKAYKGASADMMLVKNLGPSFADQSHSVFTGQVQFAYQDRQCYPVSVNASQWCL